MGQVAAEHRDNSNDEAPPRGFLAVVGSVFAAGFGVQSKENKERDFSRGQAKHFIVAGLLFTFGLLAVLIAVVNLVV
jgi:hypothetical protein